MIADAQRAGQQAAQLELRGQWLANATAEQERTARLEERAPGSRQRTRGRVAGPGHEPSATRGNDPLPLIACLPSCDFQRKVDLARIT
jgi:hypothetical protein